MRRRRQPRAPSPPRAERRAQLEAIFASIDANGDGQLSAAEVIKALRVNPLVARLLGLDHVRQEDGSRDAFERIFQQMDEDHNRKVDRSEFVAFFLERPVEPPGMSSDGDAGGRPTLAQPMARTIRDAVATTPKTFFERRRDAEEAYGARY